MDRGERAGQRLGGRLFITVRARAALRAMCGARGPQAVVMSWPSGATYLPSALHRPGPFDVIVGHVAKCPIYCDLRQLSLFRTRRMVLDVPEPLRVARRPVLRAIHLPSAGTAETEPAVATGVRLSV